MRVKATAGYNFGKTLAYLAAGSAHANIGGLGKDWGVFFGFGLADAIAPETAISNELLDHDFSDFDSSGVKFAIAR
jgi:outer membrane immunogenic protein